MNKKVLAGLTAILLSVGIFHGAAAQDSCEAEMKTVVDKFTKKKTIYTSILDALSMSKSIIGSKSYYYLSLKSYAETRTVNKQGVSILFADGTKFEKPLAKVSVESKGDDQYLYESFFEITPAEVVKFTEKKVTDIRLYIHDNEIGERNAREFQCGAAELLKIKK